MSQSPPESRTQSQSQFPQTAQALNQQFGMAGVLRFEPGPGGLARATVTTDHGEAWMFTYGGHVCGWRPSTATMGQQDDVLWMSGESKYELGTPIRGGVPVCFPWFAEKANDPEAPMHGLARTQVWEVSGAIPTEDGACLFLTCHIEPWDCTLTVGVGRDLTLSLKVTNVDAAARTFEAAFHTYFNVSDVRQAQVTGLEGAQFIDKAAGGQRDKQGPGPITFGGETDRLYLNTTAAAALDDPAKHRRIVIDKSGSNSTVVWNPWTAKAARMEDFGDDEWPGMVCVETASARENAITLDPRQSHEMTATIRVEPI